MVGKFPSTKSEKLMVGTLLFLIGVSILVDRPNPIAQYFRQIMGLLGVILGGYYLIVGIK